MHWAGVVIVLLFVLLVADSLGGCGRWVVRYDEQTDYLQDPLFDILQDEAQSDGGKAIDDAAAYLANDSTAPTPDQGALRGDSTGLGSPEAGRFDELSGLWIVTMKTAQETSLVAKVDVVQGGTELLGQGNLTDQESEIPINVNATGTASQDWVGLDLIPVPEYFGMTSYRLHLGPRESGSNLLQGDYTQYRNGEYCGKGRVEVQLMGK